MELVLIDQLLDSFGGFGGRVARSKFLHGSIVDSGFHSYEVDKIARNEYEFEVSCLFVVVIVLRQLNCKVL